MERKNYLEEEPINIQLTVRPLYPNNLKCIFTHFRGNSARILHNYPCTHLPPSKIRHTSREYARQSCPFLSNVIRVARRRMLNFNEIQHSSSGKPDYVSGLDYQLQHILHCTVIIIHAFSYFHRSINAFWC